MMLWINGCFAGFRKFRMESYVLLTALLWVIICPMMPMTSVAASDEYGFSVSRTPRELVAERLVLMGMMNYVQSYYDEAMKKPNLEMAEILLEYASTYKSEDPELWSLRAEIAMKLDDKPGWERALREYIRLRPEDDTAQLELIFSRLTSMETLDARLSRLESIMGSTTSRALSPSVRSYLASFAAGAARELGDTDKFARWLKQATQLDPANQDAAMMMVDFTRERGGSPLHMGASLIHLVKASPLMAGARLQLAELLASEAVYSRAAEQYRLAMHMSGRRLPHESERNMLLCLGASGLDEEAMAFLTDISQMSREPEPDETEQEAEQEEEPSPSSEPLSPDLQLFRTAIIYDPANPESSDASLGELLATIENGMDMDPDQREYDQLWLQAMFGHDMGMVDEQIRGLGETDHVLVKRAQGWMHLRTGDHDRARMVFEEYAEQDPPCAYGLALLSGMDEAGQSRALREVIRRFPQSLGAMLAARELNRMQRPVEPTTTGNRLLEMMSYVSPQVWSMKMKSATEWVQMRIKSKNPRAAILEPIMVEVTVRNVSPLPLGVGEGRTISKMVLLSPAVFSDGRPIPVYIPPIEVDMSRRLTLNPGESIVVDMDIKRYAVGGLLGSRPNTSFTINVSAMLDPVPTPVGPIPGPMGSTDIVRAIQAWGLPVTDQNIELWLRQLDSHRIIEQMEAIVRLTSMVVNSSEVEDESHIATLDRIADAINRRYPQYQSMRQAWTILSIINEKDDGNARLQRVFDLAKRSEHEIVLISYLTVHVKRSDSEVLASALRHDNPRIKRFAEAMKQVLAYQESRDNTDQNAEAEE